ncbi:MAG TPA: hypothetical protein VKZ63_19250, partial [Kofleriaceae bacterium]|nr:hypothetical protein [Kofleriaceae bacterium]
MLRRPSIALAAALALWAGLAGGAEAQRVRARSAAPAARTARGTPAGSAARVARGTPAGAKARASRNLLGEGWFSRVYASRDGAYVVKQMKPQIGDVVPITPRRRAELARRTVRASETLRKAGLPVPRTFMQEGSADVIVQERAGGLELKALRGPARDKARRAATRLFRKARRVARDKKATTWYIDENLANLRFDRTGKETAWIDPVVPIKGEEAWNVIDRRHESG